jgi:hypothetical protein
MKRKKKTQRLQVEKGLLYMGLETECTCLVIGCVKDTDLKDYVDVTAENLVLAVTVFANVSSTINYCY